MTTDPQMSSEMKQLLSDVFTHANQHLTEVGGDLQQATSLLAEAIEKLNSNFTQMCETINAQQRIIETIAHRINLVGEESDALKANTMLINRHINAAVTNLQFQDMTDQLISRIVKRVEGLKLVLATLKVESLESVSSRRNSYRAAAELRRVDALLIQKSVELEKALWKAVCQTHMESGDVELF